MLINELTFVTDPQLEDIVDFVRDTISDELNMNQQSEFNKWIIEFRENRDSDMDNFEIINVSNLEGFYDRYIEKLINHFGVDLDFSILTKDVVSELTQLQVITLLKEINSIKKSNTETVTLSRLREKYRNTKKYLSLSFLIDDEVDILRLLEIVKMEDPVNVEGQIIDLDNFSYVVGDGHWSNHGWDIYINPETKQLVEKEWSKWQGAVDQYRHINLNYYINDVLTRAHTKRNVKGLKEIIEIITK